MSHDVTLQRVRRDLDLATAATTRKLAAAVAAEANRAVNSDVFLRAVPECPTAFPTFGKSREQVPLHRDAAVVVATAPSMNDRKEFLPLLCREHCLVLPARCMQFTVVNDLIVTIS